MSLVIARGGQLLREEVDLRALLAAVVRLENVGVFLGAGASLSVGGNTMERVWQSFVDACGREAAWLTAHSFVEPTATHSDPALRKAPNVERLFDSIEIAAREWARAGNTELPELVNARAVLLRFVVRAALLNHRWWESPDAARSTEVLQGHRQLLQKLVGARQPGQASPWVFTTNYDLAIEWAAESIELQILNGFLGTHGRRFSPQSFDLALRNSQARGEARFGVYNIYLAKLHGSLTWNDVAGDVYETPAPACWGAIRDFLDDPSRPDPGLMVMPRAAKYMQTVGFVTGELLRRFSEFLSRPQVSLLISGYGFGDEHINRILLSALLNPTLQLVVYFPDFHGDTLATTLPSGLRHLLSLKSPRVTVVGGKERAYFDAFVGHLPEPALFDDELLKYRQLLTQPPGTGGANYTIEVPVPVREARAGATAAPLDAPVDESAPTLGSGPASSARRAHE